MRYSGLYFLARQNQRMQYRTISHFVRPCGKQHSLEIPTPDFVRTLRQYPLLDTVVCWIRTFTYKIRRGYFAGVRYCAIWCDIWVCISWQDKNHKMQYRHGESMGDVQLRNAALYPTKRRASKAERTFQNALSKHFSTICSPNRLLTPLKSASPGNAF